MEEEKGDFWIGFILVAGVIWLLLGGYKSHEQKKEEAASQGYYYEDTSSEKVEMENPYSSESGHGAGYDWAERTGGDCNAASESFNEGCEEYYFQASGGN